MKKKWLIPLLGFLVLLSFFEIFNSRYSIILMIIGLGSLALKNKFSKKHQAIILFIAMITLSLALFTSRFFLLILIIIILLFISENQPIYDLLKDSLFKRGNKNNKNEFIIVDFEKTGNSFKKIKKNNWIGTNNKSTESIYSWEDVNFSKLIGDSIFDLGNTLLPREQNIILIRQGIGNIKVLIPEGTAVAIDFSVLVGNLIVDGTKHDLLNENLVWYSDNYQTQTRKVKIVTNLLVGELEVFYL